jgi:hypothetical protein
VLLAGHSQGAHSVAVAGAVDPLVRGVILSGCGGDLRIGVLGRRDLPVLPFFRAMLGLGADELDVMHPLMALVQTLADPVDPASYARLYWEPLEGRRAPDVLHFEGLGDSFSPPATAEILALALHATPVLPLTKPIARLRERETTLAELLERPGPVRAFAQLAPTRGEDGHFVMFREPEGRSLAMELMRATVR